MLVFCCCSCFCCRDCDVAKNIEEEDDEKDSVELKQLDILLCFLVLAHTGFILAI